MKCCKLCGLEMNLDGPDTPIGELAAEELAEAAGVEEEDPLCYGCIGRVVARVREELKRAQAAFEEELLAHCPGEESLRQKAHDMRELQSLSLALTPWSSR